MIQELIDSRIQETLDQELLVKDFWEAISQTNQIDNNRQRRNIIYKHAFFTCCRELTGLSLSSIGGVLGKDHATVLHAVRNHSINYLHDANYREVYDQMYDSLDDRIQKFNDGINDMIEKRINRMDVEVYNTTVIEMYKKKLRNQRKANDLQIDALKKEMNILRKALKASRNREKSLNEECKRLKNLL